MFNGNRLGYWTAGARRFHTFDRTNPRSRTSRSTNKSPLSSHAKRGAPLSFREAIELLLRWYTTKSKPAATTQHSYATQYTLIRLWLKPYSYFSPVSVLSNQDKYEELFLLFSGILHSKNSLQSVSINGPCLTSNICANSLKQTVVWIEYGKTSMISPYPSIATSITAPLCSKNKILTWPSKTRNNSFMWVWRWNVAVYKNFSKYKLRFFEPDLRKIDEG